MLTRIVVTMIIAMVLPACHYLDEKPYDWAQPVDVFSMEANYEKPVNQAYSYLQGGFNRISGAFLDAATDDGMCTVDASAIHRLSRGYITSSNPVVNCWSSAYKGIRQALFVQKGLSEIDLVLNNKTSDEVWAIKNRYSGEMYCLRALFEFDLLRHYGGYPILDKYYMLGDPELNDKKRGSFADCVSNITRLCDSAAKYLDVTPVGGNGGYGRMTKGAALAIKAKTLVFAASPLFNQNSNSNPLAGYVSPGSAAITERWQDAAEACAAVINLKNTAGKAVYALHANYEKLFVTVPNNEYIVSVTAPKSTDLENRQYPPSLSKNSGGGTVPSQEFADAFTKADGSDYTRADLAAQYRNRDPRFNMVMGFNGATYAGLGTIFTKRGEDATMDALNAVVDRSTNTGYYLRKFLDLNINFTKASPGTAFHVFPMIRLADILLLYAEAMNEAYGPDTDPHDFGLTARAAVQKVRSRAGFTAADKYLQDVVATSEMRIKIKNERRIELAFEEQRYFDLRRWMEGDKLNQPVNGIQIEQKNGTLTAEYFTVDALRRFETKMYLHPIPLNETMILPGIVQNPGW